MARRKTNKDGTPDKRVGKKPNKGWCGTRQPEGTLTGAFKIKARDLFDTVEDLRAFARFFAEKEAEFENIIADLDGETALALAESHSKGNYYTELGEVLGKPWLESFLKANNAWYWHNDAAVIERAANSVNKRREIESVCEAFGWDESKKKEIQEAIHENTGKWKSQSHIANTCRSRTISSFPSEPDYVIDYGTQVKYTIEGPHWDKNDIENERKVSYVIKFGDKERRYKASASLLIPLRLILSPIRIADGGIRKPLFYRDPEYCKRDLAQARESGEDELGLDLVASIPYWYYPSDLALGPGILGVDLGILRVFRAGALYPGGHYVENLDPDGEIERWNAHIEKLKQEKSELYEKIQHNEKLLGNADPSHPGTAALARKLENQREQYSGVRSNIAGEREALEWLVANNVARLAREFACGEVHCEDLRWVGGHGQSWDYGKIISKIEQVAGRYGIRVTRVSAYKTSQLDPSTGEELSARDDDARTFTWADGSEHDRDGSAALVIAGRPAGYGASQSLLASVPVEKPFGVVPDEGHDIVRGGGKRARKKPSSKRGGASHPSQPVECRRGYRGDGERFGSSVRERVREFLDALNGDEGRCSRFSMFSFVESSRSVACLLCCRSQSPATRQSRSVKPTHNRSTNRSQVSKKIPKQR